MVDIQLPMELLKKLNMTINEYLVLHNIVNKGILEQYIRTNIDDLVGLESKGYIKLTSEGLFLRGKAEDLFSVNDDFFAEWLELYPVSVKKKNGGTRALSPDGPDTILGKKLREKWDKTFKHDVSQEKRAIEVLKSRLKDMRQSGDLEWMEMASTWLNQGLHEKYSYLLDSNKDESYMNEDYL